MAMRIIAGIFLALHGISHLVGFVVPWKIATLKEEPYKTTLLSGSINVGDIGIRVVGILWLLAAAGFIAAAAGAFAQSQWWRPLSLGLSVFSFFLCILGLPGARIGILANVIILLYLTVGGYFGV
ncbi:MAG: ABC transporter permease [Spirochaetes bacterium]|nr:ABC transporter permease [Spirochaetota bacterium]